MRISDWSSDVCSSDLQIAQIFDLKRRAVEALLSVRPRYQEQGLLRIGIAEDGDVDREFLVLGAACRRVHSRYDRRTARRGQRQEFLAGFGVGAAIGCGHGGLHSAPLWWSGSHEFADRGGCQPE